MKTTIESTPFDTPTIIKRLLIATAAICIGSALSEPFFNAIFGTSGLQQWLSLSWYGIKNFAIWQPLTYLFVQYTGTQIITLPFLISLLFNLYMLWITGSVVVRAVGEAPFLRFYLLCGIFVGLISLYAMKLTGQYQVLSGAWPAIFAVLTVWTFLNPDLELLFLFVFPIKAKWLFLGLFLAFFLIDLTQGLWVKLVFDLSGPFFGYLYALFAWDIRSPFPITNKLDRMLLRLKGIKPPVKIYDIKTGKAVKKPQPPQDDDQFVDEMLTKISQKGANSLTRQERQRMDAISERKRKKR